MPTKTAADVPAIGGGFNPYSADAVGVDPANGNFRFSTTDISIPAVGTPLAITRTLDTLLMSGTSVVNGAFGKGWMFPLDMKIRTDTDGNAFVVLPDGREEFHGKNPDGSYSRALGASTILTKDATRWHLQELSGTIYDFDIAEGKLLQATDKVGHVLSSTWPTATTQVLTDVASGRSLTLTYESSGTRLHITHVVTTAVAANGGPLEWRYYYSGDLLVKACDPRDNSDTGKCEVYGYDTPGRLVTITGVRGNLHTTLTYDTAGRVSTRADALGNTWTFGWVTPDPTITSPTGASITVHRATVTDPLSHTTTYDFDGARRLIHRAGPDGTHRWYSFDANGFVSQFFNELGQVEQYTNDAFGNVTSRKDSLNYEWKSGFDANGSMLWAEDAEGHRTTFTYVNGLKMSETTPLGAVTAWTYTSGTEAAYGSSGTMPAGLLRTVTDPLAHVTVTNDYNAAGDLTRTTDAAGKQTITTYDEIGRPVSTSTVWSGRNGSTTTTSTTAYDALSRVVTVIDPIVVNPVSLVSHQQRTTNVYDDNGNLTQVTVDDTFGNDQPRVTVFGYDADDRQTSSLDSENGTTTRTFDGAGNVIEVTDPLLRVTQTTYDAANRPLDVILKDYTNPAAPAAPRDITLSQTTYDALGREATITDAIGNVTQFTYDVRGNRTKAELLNFQPLTGATYNFVLSERWFSAANRLVAEESGNGAQRVEYLYDNDGRRTTETFKVGPVAGVTLPDKVVETVYDAASNVTKTSISDGPHTEERRYSYDAANRPVTTTVENGAIDLVTYATYDQLGNPETVVDARGSSATDATYMTINSYDILGRLFKTELPAVSIEAFGVAATTARPTKLTGRNTFGDTTHTVDGAGNVTTAAYDRLGRQTTITAPVYTQPGSNPATLQPTEVRSYDAVGNLIASTDRRGSITDYEFDSLNRATRQTAPAANVGDPRAVSTVTYGDTGLVLARTDAQGSVTDYGYDKLGRVRTVTEHVTDNGVVQALVTTNDYDGAGNQISSTDPTGATTTAVYDRTGQQLRTTDPLGYVTTFEYDVAGRQTKVTSPSGASTRTVYDLAGRAIESAAYTATGVKLLWTTAGYDNVGNKVTSTDKVGTTTTYTYDATNTLTGVAQPVAAGSTVSTGYGYDANGNNTRVADGNGHVWWTTYNPWGLTESRIEPATAAYPDLADRTFTTSYDSGGLPVKEFQPDVTISRTFDARGQLAAESSDGGGNRAFSYDLAGRPIVLTSGSTSITLGYNERNQLLNVTGSAGSSAFRYDAAGRTTERQDAAGTTSYSWNPNGQLYQIGDPVTGNTITYTWAAPGAAHAGSLTTVATGSGTTRTYGYDDLDRVTSDTTTAGANTLWSASYGYDSNTGLVQSKTIAPAGVAGAGTNSYSYDLAGRLTGWVNPANVTTGYTYDGAGNRTSNGATAIVFDERNRIVSEGAKNYVWDARGTLDTISDGTSSSSYTFDGLGRMTSVDGVGYSYDALDRIITRAGVTFTYSGTNNQPTSDGTTVLSRSPDGSALAVAQGATRLNLLADRHGDVIATTTSAGVVTDTVAFTPWGEQAARQGSTALTVGFQGSYTDPTTGLIDMGARWYQASTGTFTNRDTYNGVLSTPISLNRYTYANGNPLSYFDPDGRSANRLANIDGGGGPGKTSNIKAAAKSPSKGNPAKSAKAALPVSKQSASDWGLDMKADKRIAQLQTSGSNTNWADDPVLRQIDQQLHVSPFSVLKANPSVAGRTYIDSLSEDMESIVYNSVLSGGLRYELGELENINAENIARGFGDGAAAYYRKQHRQQIKAILAGMITTHMEYWYTKDYMQATVAELGGYQGDPAFRQQYERAVNQSTGAFIEAAAVVGFFSAWGASGHVPSTSPGQRDFLSKHPATEAESGVLNGGVCSFDPDTKVLMADGTTKAIKDVAIGDSVEAADPSSGQDQGGRSVTALHSHQDDDLIDINVTGRDGKLHVIHTTARHPFWEDTSHTWVPAGNLRAGQELRTVDGRDVVIADVSDRSGESEMLNLTVSGLHTFYVKAGDVAVLVHNTCGDGFGRGGQRLSPDPAAGGSPHSTFRTDPVTGEVTHYTTWEPNPQNPLGYDPVLRYDGVGGAHFNKIDQIDIPTPHVQGPGIPGGVRPAQPWEIPWR
ncbi:MAG: RHS repeat-associated core domain-containing protein [Actinomycetota bacterium]|nr:RHS repeat-associated core domain-containing protein [Actinomycetota bacterium]